MNNSVSDDPAKWAAKTADWREGACFNGPWTPVGTVAGCNVYQGSTNLYGTYLVAINQEHEQVGDLFYVPLDDEPGRMEGAVEIDPRWRRRGIATFLYEKAEELTGMVLRPASPHTDLAEAFWQQPGRKFGRA